MADKVQELRDRHQIAALKILEKIEEGHGTIDSLLQFIDEPNMTKEQKVSELYSIIGILQTFDLVKVSKGNVFLL